jgi:DNA repair exonuclease SbcCD ATPase subunit
MLEIPSQGKVKIHWNVTHYDYSKDKEAEIIAVASKKYKIPKDRITVVPNIIALDKNGNMVTLKDCVIDNIQDPQFQKKLFREYIELNKIENADLDYIDKVDNSINASIDYQSYSKPTKYSIKWVKWSNFRSYGPDNFFDFTKLHNLVLLNSNPANQGGKTTFAVDLLHFLLFGNMPKAQSYADIYNDFLPKETNVTVEGELEIEGENYIIKRTLSRPQLSRRTPKSRVSQKVEYYRVIGDEREELKEYVDENEDDVRKTNKVIRESIGREDDFDLIMCITGSNLDKLTDDKPTERGRNFARWIGLLPLEKKDEVAKNTFNSSIKPKLLSNQYNKETLIQETEAYNVEIEKIARERKVLEDNNKELLREIQDLERKKEELNKTRLTVDQDVLKIDIATLQSQITNKLNEGKIAKEKLELSIKERNDIGEVEYSVEQHDMNSRKLIEANSRLTEKRTTVRIKQEALMKLKQYKICPTCGQEIHNEKQIEEEEKSLKTLIDEGILIRKEVEAIEKAENEYKSKRDTFNKLNTLNSSIAFLESKLNTTRQEYKELKDMHNAYETNKEAIDRNNQIDIEIRNNNTLIDTKRQIKDNNIRRIAQMDSDTNSYKKEIETRKNLVSQMTLEEKKLYNWKIYLEMIGKNGISKMVMRKALPIINARLMQLLDGVCDFNVSININTSNEVEFIMEQDGITSTLYSHGSGFERTASALALRCVLAEISTISKCNFVIIDEVLGRIAKENFDNMRSLYERIAKNYDFIFQITHNEEVKEWHDEIVTVEKINHISHIKVRDNK